MACLVADAVLSFHAVVSVGSLGMLYTVSQYSLYLHSYLTSILISVLVASSILFPSMGDMQLL